MSSTVLLNLLRCGRSTIARQTFLAARSSPGTSTASGQVNLHAIKTMHVLEDYNTLLIVWLIGMQVDGVLFGVVGARRASGSVRFDSDGSGQLVTWDSFGIWDNRIEEPILLPSSIRYGKPIPQVTGWMDEWEMDGWKGWLKVNRWSRW